MEEFPFVISLPPPRRSNYHSLPGDAADEQMMEDFNLDAALSQAVIIARNRSRKSSTEEQITDQSTTEKLTNAVNSPLRISNRQKRKRPDDTATLPSNKSFISGKVDIPNLVLPSKPSEANIETHSHTNIPKPRKKRKQSRVSFDDEVEYMGRLDETNDGKNIDNALSDKITSASDIPKDMSKNVIEETITTIASNDTPPAPASRIESKDEPEDEVFNVLQNIDIEGMTSGIDFTTVSLLNDSSRRPSMEKHSNGIAIDSRLEDIQNKAHPFIKSTPAVSEVSKRKLQSIMSLKRLNKKVPSQNSSLLFETIFLKNHIQVETLRAYYLNFTLSPTTTASMGTSGVVTTVPTFSNVSSTPRSSYRLDFNSPIEGSPQSYISGINFNAINNRNNPISPFDHRSIGTGLTPPGDMMNHSYSHEIDNGLDVDQLPIGVAERSILFSFDSLLTGLLKDIFIALHNLCQNHLNST